MKKFFALLLVLSLALVSLPAFAEYPEQNVTGVVQWGAGGGTDSLMRPLSAIAEQNLGKSIIIQNMTGATGSIATQYVYDAPADGYTLLMGAENPALYDILEISELTYDDFDCVYLSEKIHRINRSRKLSTRLSKPLGRSKFQQRALAVFPGKSGLSYPTLPARHSTRFPMTATQALKLRS